MQNNNDRSRRRFLVSTGALAAATYVRIAGPSLVAITQAACTARAEGNAFRVLTTDEAADLAAITARIIPTTDTPGAAEAGVIHFFDNAFAAEMSGGLEAARIGLRDLNAAIGGDTSFADLPAGKQDAMLRSIQDSGFFGLVWEMTIYGFFAMSEYGGNRNDVGWELIGFKGHSGSWQYPFGYYDAEVHGGTGDAG